MTDAAAPRVTLLGKPGCHLCDDARAVIAAVTAELGEAYAEVDITHPLSGSSCQRLRGL